MQSRPGRARGEFGDRWLQLDMSVSTGHGKRSVGSGCILKVGAVGRPSRLDVGCKGGDDGGAWLGQQGGQGLRHLLGKAL